MATNVFLCPLSSFMQVFTDAGIPLSGCLIWTSQAGTSTPVNTWTDSTGTVTNSNPIQLNSAGRLNNVNIWQQSGTKIKVVFSTNAGTSGSPVFGTQIGPTFDQIAGVGDPGTLLTVFYGGTDTGSANNYVLNFVSNFNSYINGLVIYWIPANSNTGASTININGLGAVNITNSDGSALVTGQLNAGKIAVIVSQGGNFILTNLSVLTGSFTGTFTGFGTTVTATVQYRVYNNMVSLFFNTTNPSGTSNSASMTMTGLPSLLFPVVNRFILCCTQDNGNSEQFSAMLVTTSGAVTFEKYSIATGNFSAVGYTSSGSKGLSSDWFVTYPLS
jgi:hypothetical protein